MYAKNAMGRGKFPSVKPTTKTVSTDAAMTKWLGHPVTVSSSEDPVLREWRKQWRASHR